MKHICLILFLFTQGTFVFAQNNVIKYTYKFQHRPDSASRWDKATMLLYYDGNTKWFLPEIEEYAINKNVEKFETQMIETSPNNFFITKSVSDLGNSYQKIFKDLKKNQTYDFVDYKGEHLCALTSDSLVWEIKDSIYFNKRFGINHQVATTKYRGKTFAAGFVTTHPISVGPFKFDGLPGLIFAVNDLERTFSWVIQNFDHEVVVDANLVSIEEKLKDYTILPDSQLYAKKEIIAKKAYAEDKLIFQNITSDGRPSTYVPNMPADLLIDRAVKEKLKKKSKK